MPADLKEKVVRYEDMLKRALLKAKYAPIPNSHMYAVAEDYYTMAKAYYSDGLYFLEQKDPVNALVAFSYGHAWLDAGAKLGIFAVDDETLFTI
ncbi:MAG: DUF357 domain-containing protein [Methanosarcinaceae archaeon]|nr:DUF357 domain-containing protein [Methanosarcinaceae archaeon]MDD4332293.1 DUF357 domain-containing protein [Methanosarcinaceae archaeon]MDD4748752.1 DUF357 domain-containing protein [Methanosarcinaceae archaeon]